MLEAAKHQTTQTTIMHSMPLHVRVTRKDRSRNSNDVLVLDKDEDWIGHHVVGPRQRGSAMFIGGQVIEWDDVQEIHITESDANSTELLPAIRARRAAGGVFTPISDEWYVAFESREVTERFLHGLPGSRAQEEKVVEPPRAHDPASVMVVHGQDEEATAALFNWLRAIGLRPREWSQLVAGTRSGSPFIGEVLDHAFQEAQAVVALFTPDEHVGLRGELTNRAVEWRLQARPNVLFEAGIAFATHPAQTVLVVLGDQDLPTDLAGRHYVRLGNATALHELAKRLETAGCPVDLSGQDWLDATRFPDRSGTEASPRLVAGSVSSAQSNVYGRLLAAHAELLLAYAGPNVYEGRIRVARSSFEEAQTAVLIHGTPAVRWAAEQLRTAWIPRRNGLYMGSDGWQSEVEDARIVLIEAIHGEGT
jgi:predicted nucleotide-binding protein